MRKSAVAYFHFLAQPCADPTKAAKAMIETGSKHIKMTKKQSTFITLDKLKRKKMGTPEVEAASKKIFRSNRRDQGYIEYVMRRKVEDARAQAERERRRHRAGLDYLVSVLPEHIAGHPPPHHGPRARLLPLPLPGRRALRPEAARHQEAHRPPARRRQA
jgi:hypothetical protein